MTSHALYRIHRLEQQETAIQRGDTWGFASLVDCITNYERQKALHEKILESEEEYRNLTGEDLP